MAYRLEKNQNGQQDLVIDGWEKGIAPSPFKGLGNIRNFNIKYYEGIVYVNYKRQRATIQNSAGVDSGTVTITIATPAVLTLTGSNFVAGETITLETTGALPTGLSTGVTYYIISSGLGADSFQISATRGGSAINTSGSQSGTHTLRVVSSKPVAQTKSGAGVIYFADDARNIYQQTAANSATFKHLTGNFSQAITGLQWWNDYLFVMGQLGSTGRFEICGDGTGDAGVTSSNWNTTAPVSVVCTISIATPAVITATSHGLKIGQEIKFSTTGALPTGILAGVKYYVSATSLSADTFEIATSYANAIAGTPVVNTSGTQSGTQSYSATYGTWPIRNSGTITFGSAPIEGATSGTISTCTDGGNNSRGVWNCASGAYNVQFDLTNGSFQTVVANLTQGSNVVTWQPALNANASNAENDYFWSGTTGNSRYNNASMNHPSIVAQNTGDMYFGNGSMLGAMTLNLNQQFNKSDFDSFTFYANILALPTYETVVDMTELRDNLIIQGTKFIYPWDFVQPFWTIPVPMDESIVQAINILNNIYIFAGNKGNIYISNGYSVSRFAKLPDYVAGVVDPSWTIGGVMQHRQKLYFQAMAKNGQTGTVLLAGNFSLDLDTGAINMENEYSGGLAPTGLDGSGFLSDVSDTSVNYDKYYSAYGADVSRIEYNDTTLYSSNEPTIETDIVPIGTFLQPRTFSSIEFKLDQPMQSGDSITVYARESLSASYTLLGTTTTAVLSDCFQKFPTQKYQWIQFKIVVSCNATATSSSFMRIREIRVR